MRPWWIGAVHLCALLAFSALAADGGRLSVARSHVSRGEKLLARDRPERAEEEFRKAIEQEPIYPAAYLGLGRALVAQQRFPDAVATLEAAKRRYVEWDQLARQVELEARSDATQRAREFADLQRQQRAKRGPSPLQPSPSRSLTDLAAGRVATEKFLAQRGWGFEEFAAIPVEVFYLEGLSLLRTGSRQAGMEDLLLALELEPEHGLAHYNLAVALFSGGEVAAAKEHLEAAIAAGVTPHPRFAADVEAAAKALAAQEQR